MSAKYVGLILLALVGCSTAPPEFYRLEGPAFSCYYSNWKICGQLFCIPDNEECCSQDSGVSCLNGSECCASGDTFVCIPSGSVCCSDGTYCGAGSVCGDGGVCQ